MAPNLFVRLVSACGFCCPYAFLRAVRGRGHALVANRLGVHPFTVYYWRRKEKEGRCKCGHHPLCAKDRLGEIPRLPLVEIREGVQDPFVNGSVSLRR